MWHNYDATITRKIEALYSAGGGGSVGVEICGRNYEIDVGSMQQVNKDTKVTRKIQRCVASSSSSSEATLPTATAVDAASSSTHSVTTTSSRNKSNKKSKKGWQHILVNFMHHLCGHSFSALSKLLCILYGRLHSIIAHK